MQAAQAMGSRLGRIGRRWRRLSLRRRLVLILVAASIGGWSTWRAYRWWADWPARLTLQAEGGHSPVAFSPDGSKLLTRVDWGRSLILWDAKGGERVASWTDSDKRMRFSGAFSPDGRTFASPWYLAGNGKNFSVDLVDVATGKARSTFDSPLSGCLGVRFREGGREVRLLATGRTSGRRVVDVDVASGKVLSDRPLASTVPLASLGLSAMSGDGRLLVLPGPAATSASGGPATATVWDLDEDREAFRLPTTAGGGTPEVAAFSADGRSLALGFADGRVEVWDVASRTLRCTSRAHGAGYCPSVLAFSPDGSTVASTGHFRRLTLAFDVWKVFYAHAFRAKGYQEVTDLVLLDAKTGRTLRRASGSALAVFSPDGRALATADEDRAVRIHDAPSRR